MGHSAGEQIDGWLRKGGMVVASSDRAARALQSAYHRRRRDEGLAAWETPSIQPWTAFVRSAWDDYGSDGRLLLSAEQELAIWANIIRDGQTLSTSLDAPVLRLARLAMEAHKLLCFYSPKYLDTAARSGWDGDPGTFSHWLEAFDDACKKHSLFSSNRISLELILRLQRDSSNRLPLLAAGFDRLLPIQRNILDAWGNWQPLQPHDRAARIGLHKAIDSQSELDACACWCNRELAVNPDSRLLIITQDIASRRGEIERAFLRFSNNISNFEFSLGLPLGQLSLPRAALLLLRWLQGSLDEPELDWLIGSRMAASPSETADLEVYMRLLRQKNLQRAQWTFVSFIQQPVYAEKLPFSWIQRVISAQRKLRESGRRLRAPLEWAEVVVQSLEILGWPWQQANESASFQILRRWQQTLDTTGSLGFDDRRIDWTSFLGILDQTLRDTLFALESQDAPIQIAGPAESAGLSADRIWFLGADEQSWPATNSTHPLLPLDLQRRAAMPHALPQQDWDLANAITSRLASSADIVHFSFAGKRNGADARPSRIVQALAGPPIPFTPEMTPPRLEHRAAEMIEDYSKVPFAHGALRGGSRILTSQSQCPFKAFAAARLGAEDWQPAEIGLIPLQRGKILHAILHSVWSGPPNGIRSLEDLLGLQDSAAFVTPHVQRAMRDEVPASVLERMPRRYLELEKLRLVQLVTEWLNYEAQRISFSVTGTEVERSINLAGLTVKLRIDRIDQLNDGSLLVMDYKTGDVTAKSWDLPRPDDIQVPLYARFCIDSEVGGLVFARIKPFDHEFVGNVVNAKATIRRNLTQNNRLVKKPLTGAMLEQWKTYIEGLASDFIAGRADVDPNNYPKTCERCGLQTICRICEPENRTRLETEDAWDAEVMEDE
jgi:ATP-dependent helicase/nuclease subunit B